MKRLCTICVRGGSKGLPNKNARPLLGKPLLAHTVEQALRSERFIAVAVSSDSDELLAIAKDAGAHLAVKRPAELANDTAGKLPAIIHCAEQAEKRLNASFEIFMDLDATSPLREVADIRRALEQFENSPTSTNLLSATPSRHSPYFNQVELDSNGCTHLVKSAGVIERRQDAPKTYDLNASLYIWKRSTLFGSSSVFQENTILYVMPPERSVDVDSELDFQLVELLAKKRGTLV